MVPNSKKSLLILKQGDNLKNKIKYILQKTEFDSKSKRCRITIKVEREYKLLLKYDSNDDPIFSEPKVSCRIIFKNIILNKNNILSLNHHEDEVVRVLSFEIVDSLKEHHIFIPKWYIIESKERKLKENNNAKSHRLNELEIRKKEVVSSLENERKKIKNNQEKYNEFVNKLDNERKLHRKKEINDAIILIQKEIKTSEQYIIKLNQKLLDINLEKISIQKEYELNAEVIERDFKKIICNYKEDELLLDEFNAIDLIKNVNLPKTGIIIVFNNIDEKYLITPSTNIQDTIQSLFSDDLVPQRSDMYKDYLNQLNTDIRKKMFEVRIVECQESELIIKKEQVQDEYDRFRSGYQD